MAAGKQLADTELDAERRAHASSEVLGTSLQWVLAGGSGSGTVLGSALTEDDLRAGLERCYRTLAQACRQHEGAHRIGGHGQPDPAQDVGVMTCPNCGESVGERDRFCEGCGANLRVTRTPPGGPVGVAAPGEPCVGCGGTNVGADGFCEDCGRAQPTGRDRMESDLGLVAGISDKGLRRARNEDSMAFGAAGGDVAGRGRDRVRRRGHVRPRGQRLPARRGLGLRGAARRRDRGQGRRRRDARGRGQGDRGGHRPGRPVGAGHRAVVHVRVGRRHGGRGDDRLGRRQPGVLARRRGRRAG